MTNLGVITCGYIRLTTSIPVNGRCLQLVSIRDW